MRLAVLLCFSCALAFAETWSGSLVDFNCYAALERNRNPHDTLIYVDRDTNSEIRYCTPGAKAKVFGMIEPEGATFQFDAGGNAKAAELVRSVGKKSRIRVVVTGEKSGDTIKVDSVSLIH